MIEIAALISEVEQFPIDRETTAQERSRFIGVAAERASSRGGGSFRPN
jgi:hypothetical protein